MTTSGHQLDGGYVLPPPWSFEARGPIRFTLPETGRPWDWLELDEDQAMTLWRVLGEFVAYLNRRYMERPEHRVPPCWAEHGPLVEELTTLFFARWHAFSSEDGSIGGAQFFHTYTLPAFIDRMARWLGPDRLRRCQAGRHEERVVEEPAQSDEWEWRRFHLECADVDLRPHGNRGQEAAWRRTGPPDEADPPIPPGAGPGDPTEAPPLHLLRSEEAAPEEAEPDGAS